MAGPDNDVRRALEVMTAWMDVDTGVPKTADVLAAVLTMNIDEAEGTGELVLGLLKLCGVLLQNLEAHTGTTPHGTLQMIANAVNTLSSE